MPSMFGGDQCSKDYAPHMWIGDHFVGGTRKYKKVGGVKYHFGMTEKGQLVVEKEVEEYEWEIIPEQEIPKEIRMSVQTFAERKEEEKRLEKLFNEPLQRKT